MALIVVATHVLLAVIPFSRAQQSKSLTNAYERLEAGFQQPPVTSRARTLWMWMNGNITSNGITSDLEAMQRVGLGGALIFNVGEYIPKGPVDYGSSNWLDLMLHTVREADRLGLQIAMHNCPGWSSSGGPWITPAMSMQQLVWSETRVSGPGEKTIELPKPYTKLGYYRDVCVLAFPSLPGEEKRFADALTRVTLGRGASVDKHLLTDGDRDTRVSISPRNPLVLEFTEPFEARAITVWPNAGGSAISFTLEASDDGADYRQVARLTPPGPRAIEEAPSVASFKPVRARFFRLVPSRSRFVSEIELDPAARIPGWNYLANFAHGTAHQRSQPDPVPARFVIDPASVLDLSARMDLEGHLRWKVPAGAWTIIRFGQTTRGQNNIAAPDAGVGLECDKLSRAGVDFHFQHGLLPLLEKLGPFVGKSFTGLEVDSYEVGAQNWTATFPEAFEKYNGYDLHRYLPAMTGRYVGSADTSERFLWDVRRAQAQMVADNYYGRLRELCHQYGLKLFVEPYGAGPGDYDELQIAGRADVPMGEFWAHSPWDDTPSVRLAASAAHIHGEAIVGGESFTSTEQQSRYLDYPYALKTIGDFAFSLGLNQMLFHRWAHQPHPSAVPGMTMGPWGFQFDRNNTWFDQSSPWLDYLARCQFLLRQGKFVADVLYCTGEGSPQMSKLEVPRLPFGYNFDAADAETILKRAAFHDGRIVLPDGMNYRLLALPDDLKNMTPELLGKLRELVGQGMALVGPQPTFSPSLRNYPRSDEEIRRLADELWGTTKQDNSSGHACGRGTVFSRQPLGELLSKLGIEPDFEYTSRRPDAAVTWLHRRVDNADVYFVANRHRRADDVVCSFRVAGKRPEFWQPETGTIRSAAVYSYKGGRTHVPIHLEPSESVFVVFREPAETNPAEWFARNGVNLLDATPFPSPKSDVNVAISNNFTVSVWINPGTDLMFMPRESADGRINENGKSWIIPPVDGEALFGAGQSAMSLAAGRNGVAVVEKGANREAAVLVSRKPISGWTHLAVVYRDGKPSLYLDGQFIREGLASGSVVHPGLGEPTVPGKFVNYFDGDMTTPELLPKALTKDEIANLAAQGLPSPADPPPTEITSGSDGKVQALIWQNGSYSLDGDGTVTVSNLATPLKLSGPWRVRFQPGRGAPESISLSELAPLQKHSNPGVRYFAGTATYEHEFNLPASWLEVGRRVFVDLGRVAVSADVRVNGRELGVLWKPPFRIEATDVLRAGSNRLEVRVDTLWPNRLIGDEHLAPENEYDQRNGAIEQLPAWFTHGEPRPPGGRVTFATWQFFKKDDPLVESGLLGPVCLCNARRWDHPE